LGSIPSLVAEAAAERDSGEHFTWLRISSYKTLYLTKLFQPQTR